MPDLAFPSQRGDSLDLAALIGALRRRFRLMLAVVVVITGAASAYALLSAKVYKASAILLVQPPPPANGAPPNAAQDEALVLSQLDQLRSPELLRRVSVSLRLAADPAFNPAAAGAAGALSSDDMLVHRLRGLVAVSRVQRSNMLNIDASAPVPDAAARLANALADEHLALQRQNWVDGNRQLLAQMRPRAAELRARLVAADRAVADFRRSHGIVGSVEGEDSRLAPLGASLADARAQLAETAARARLTQPVADAPAAGGGSPLLASLQQQAADLKREVARLSSFYGAAWPPLVDARAQLAEVERRAAEEARRVDAQLDQATVVSSARASRLDREIDVVRGSSLRQRSANVRLMDLEREAQSLRNDYLASLTQMETLAARGDLLQIPVRVIARATPPLDAVFPKPASIIAVALLGSLALAGLVAALAEMLDRRLRSAAQVARVTGLPTLAMVPLLGAEERPRPHALLIERPGCRYSESLRGLFIELERRRRSASRLTVLVTSPLMGEGKSTLSLGLGAAAAVMWRRALVIDTDLRRPNLLQSAGLAPEAPDLVACLRGEADVRAAIRAVPGFPRLSVLGVNAPVDDATPLLGSANWSALLAGLGDDYGLIVLNAPPVLAVSDTRILLAQADTALLVARWNRTRAAALATAMECLGPPVAGVVLNAVDYPRHARQQHGDLVQYAEACGSYVGSYGPRPVVEAAA